MAKIRTKCHSCGRVWRSRGRFIDRECPTCGSAYTGPALAGGCLPKIVGLAVVALALAAGIADVLFSGRAPDLGGRPGTWLLAFAAAVSLVFLVFFVALDRTS